MIILGIETSCDDTAIAILGVSPKRGYKIPRFRVLSNIISSQTKIHTKYGGVVPSLAKREHQKNLVPVLHKALEEAKLLKNSKPQYHNGAGYEAQQVLNSKSKTLKNILEREPELLEQFIKIVSGISKPKIDFIAVTHGPGLEPALWAGVNFARALSYFWNIPLVGVDHMEGHIAANFLENSNVEFPAIALTVSGGHTQLILMKGPNAHKLLGETLDDAAGEAFDKVARMLGLPYPGGPHISRLAKKGDAEAFAFPRPMINTKDYNFSFSGLKTAVLYTIQKLTGSDPVNYELGSQQVKKLTPKTKRDLAASFQQAVVDVLIAKTIRAAKEYEVKTIMLGGGVSANEELRRQFEEKIKKELPATAYRVPSTNMSTDNAAMIAAAAYFHKKKASLARWKTLKANGNLKIG